MGYLNGKNYQKIGDELYVFEDTTGGINDIDIKRWRGQTVTPENTIGIEGKVDKVNKYRDRCKTNYYYQIMTIK